MEFYNPINDMKDLIGEWEGNIERDEKKILSTLVFRHHGPEIIQYEQDIKIEKRKKVIEIGYLFFDKLKEELKHIVMNEEGYIEVNSLISSKRAKNLTMTSTFDSGYNLPPNMMIKRDFKLKIEEKKLEISLKMGKESSLISKAVYEKIKE